VAREGIIFIFGGGLGDDLEENELEKLENQP
jgi:hypothetical protein